MECTSGESEAAAAAATTIFDVHPEIIQTQILTRLDVFALASAASTCTQFRDLSSDEQLWANVCHSKWPSTMAPRVRHVISTFSNGYRYFFADAFTSHRHSTTITTTPINMDSTRELISVVDLFHQHRLILSKVMETETVTESFLYNPFLIYMLNSSDMIQTQINYPFCESTIPDLMNGLRLSWIVIDPVARRAMNVSNEEPISVQLDWLSGEAQVRFVTVVDDKRCKTTEQVLCFVVVTLLGGENYMHVKEVRLEMEDMDGKELDGRDGLVILKRALESERIREENVGFCYMEFLKRKMERWRRRSIDR